MKRNKFTNILTIKILFLIFIIVTACTPQTNYETLSFFFDGVPNPDSLAVKKLDTTGTNLQTSQLAKSNEPKPSIHPPYEDRACDNCHKMKEGFKLVKETPELCYTCHDDFSKSFKFLHGPVASGYCTKCHDPHNSKYDKLLLSEGQNLCYECHEKNDIMRNDVHESIDDTKCWDCHNPHGEQNKLLLK